MTESGIDADDRLSSLPDELITHILSFLQTNYAVGTSVLSRRWKDLWARVSNLDLDNRLVYQPLPENISFQDDDEQVQYLRGRFMEFSSFVYKVLSQHKGLDAVRRFRFHCSIGYREPKLSPDIWFERQWVFGRLVEEIDLVLDGVTRLGLPLCLRFLPESFYTLKNLKVVKLEGVILSAAKGTVLLPSVKILQLCRILIMGLESISSFISGCPVLEAAVLDDYSVCNKNQNDLLIVSSPCLKNLKIMSHYYNMCPMVIEAPNLEELQLKEYAELKFTGSSPLSCLHSAHVDIRPLQRPDRSLDGVFHQIANAKEMFFSGWTLHHLSIVENVQVPDFPNLTHLTIQIGGSACVLHSLLRSASKLCYLAIDMKQDTQDATNGVGVIGRSFDARVSVINS